MKRFTVALTVAASVITLLGFVLSPPLREILTLQIIVQAWHIIFFAVFSVFIGFICARRLDFYYHRKSQNEIRILQHPVLMAPGDQDGTACVGTNILRSPCGTISLWVYLNRVGEGIRHLENNRYLFSMTTNPVNPPHKNVLAVCHGPINYRNPSGPSWKLWISNESGKGKKWEYPDGGEFSIGWHLIVVRWDHESHMLEFIVDGRILIHQTGFLQFWPIDYPDRAYVGRWPGRHSVHYANTYLARFSLMSKCVDDRWIRSEQKKRPQDPNSKSGLSE